MNGVFDRSDSPSLRQDVEAGTGPPQVISNAGRLADAKSEVGRYAHLRLYDRRLFDASPEPHAAMSA